jgi:hypothetical protein
LSPVPTEEQAAKVGLDDRESLCRSTCVIGYGSAMAAASQAVSTAMSMTYPVCCFFLCLRSLSLSLFHACLGLQ